MTLIHPTDVPQYLLEIYSAGERFAKQAADKSVAYCLSGQLYGKDGERGQWLMLSVPNAFVRGVFDSMDERGIELPALGDSRLDAHISVMRPDELEIIGGIDKVNERGKRFAYSLGRLYRIKNPDWKGVSDVWCVGVHSPALMELRRSYGLTSRPNDNKFDFHITVAVRRRGVLGRNETRKSDLSPDSSSSGSEELFSDNRKVLRGFDS